MHRLGSGTDSNNTNVDPLCRTYTFPTGMGSRKRKLIHYVAEQMNLKHWGIGNKNAEKTVVVSL